jgi:hypothetical protein
VLTSNVEEAHADADVANLEPAAAGKRRAREIQIRQGDPGTRETESRYAIATRRQVLLFGGYTCNDMRRVVWSSGNTDTQRPVTTTRCILVAVMIAFDSAFDTANLLAVRVARAILVGCYFYTGASIIDADRVADIIQACLPAKAAPTPPLIPRPPSGVVILIPAFAASRRQCAAGSGREQRQGKLAAGEAEQL